MRRRNKLIISGLLLGLFACTEDDGNDKDISKVNQQQFLQNMGELIVEDYNQFNTAVVDLVQKTDSFERYQDQSHLDDLQEALKNSWTSWQSVSPYDFGPAEIVALKSAVNVYKTDTSVIEQNIQSGSYNLDQLSMADAKGFPALDYLLNGKADTSLLKAYQTSTSRQQYLKAVVSNLSTKVNQVLTEWNTSYKSKFISKEGTDVGSSTGLLVNALNQHFEKFYRDNKLGIPLGVRSSGIARPDFVEVAYGKYSVDLLIAGFESIKNLYLGGSAYGLDDYLKALGASDLDASIQSQMEIIDLKINALSNPLEGQIATNTSFVQETYNELQKLIVLWKVDMPSRMGILITYQDNDGD
jgi:predicted lipoprotein